MGVPGGQLSRRHYEPHPPHIYYAESTQTLYHEVTLVYLPLVPDQALFARQDIEYSSISLQTSNFIVFPLTVAGVQRLNEFVRHYEPAWVKAHWSEETAQLMQSKFKFNAHGRLG